MKKMIKKMTKNRLMFIVMLIVFLGITASTGSIIYCLSLLTGIENFLRLIGRLTFIIIWLLLTLFIIKSLTKNKKLRYFILIIICILYIGATGFVSFNIYKAYGILDKVSSEATTYSSSIVTLASNDVKDISSLGTSKIGILNDKTSQAGYKIPQEIIKSENLKVKTVKYDSYVSMIKDLYDEKIDYLFLPSNYVVLFKNIEGLEDIESKTKIIYTKDKKVKENNSTSSNGGKITKPFTVLLMGVDSEVEGIKGASFNGDALMLITFNPDTLNTTILSIPRDTYVPIACFANKRENKITHAAWYGEECMINTIQDYTGINIDYYVKINFKGVVNLVDALNGIEVDVPISFCEQDSNRNFNNLQCLNTGLQTLNGEQALALSRHRKTVNDFVRGQNQQLVVKALMNKVRTINSLDTIYKLLDTISNNMETNMSTSEILSLYNVAKDITNKTKDMPIDELLSMQRLYLSGYDQYIYDYSNIDGKGTRMSLYNFVAYKGSLKDVTKAMKINLGLEEAKPEKSFEFDVDTPYEEKVIGKGEYNESGIALVPSFIGYSKDYAQSWCNRNGITLNVKYTTVSSGRIGQIIDQSAPKGMDAKYVGKMTITVVNSVTSSNTTSKSESKNENKKPTTTPEPTPTPTPTPDDDTDEDNQDNNTNDPALDASGVTGQKD